MVTCELAQATSFFLGNMPTNEENITFANNATGMLIQGFPSNNPQLTVNLTSSQVLLAATSGQGNIFASPPAGIAQGNFPLLNAAITMANGDAYSDLIFNPNVGGNPGNCPTCQLGGTAFITVQAVSSDGILQAPEVFSFTMGPGNNFATLIASPGQFIASTTIETPGGVSSLSQTRISGPYGIGVVPEIPVPVPDPNTVSLLGFGLTAFGLCFKKLRRRYDLIKLVTNQSKASSWE